jgi:hypothetical protein
MSVDETASACSEQDKVLERIEKWRAQRAELAEQGKGPVRPAGEVTTLFQVIPAYSLARRALRDPWCLSGEEKQKIYVPHGSTHFHYNADGYICSAQDGDQTEAYAYTQLFRSGIAEYANSHCYAPTPAGRTMILGQEIEKETVLCYQDAINRLRRQGTTGAIYIGLSLIGIADKSIFSTVARSALSRAVFTCNIFNSPEVLINLEDQEELPYSGALLPLFNCMWQLCGLEESPFKSNVGWEPFRTRY